MDKELEKYLAAIGADRVGVSPQDRMVILANSNVSRGKYAAAAVHAALAYYGIPHGAVIVLGASPGTIEEECEEDLVIHDAGKTEVTPGTVTAGIKSPPRW